MNRAYCPECGHAVREQFTFGGYIFECHNCDWYDPDP